MPLDLAATSPTKRRAIKAPELPAARSCRRAASSAAPASQGQTQSAPGTPAAPGSAMGRCLWQSHVFMNHQYHAWL
jgi:hypothetical protein